MKLDHVAFYVADPDKCAEFLRKHYNAKVGETSPVNPATLQTNTMVSFDEGADIELMYKPSINEPTLQMHPGLGYHHTAISVGSDENYEKTIEGLMDDGYIFLTGPRVNSFGGKEGIVLGEGGNLTIQTSPGQPGHEGSFLNHVGFFVKDNKEEAKWWCEFLDGKDNGCSKINRKTGQDNYMIGYEQADVELMTCPNMIPEIDHRYEKLGFAHIAFTCDSEKQYDDMVANILNHRYQALQGPRVNSGGVKECIIKTPSNIAVQLICPKE